MGQYLKMGICYKMEIDKKNIDRLGLTNEILINELNKGIEISLFDSKETNDVIIFEIKESVVLEQLKEFMGFQYSLYSQEKHTVNFFNRLQN